MLDSEVDGHVDDLAISAPASDVQRRDQAHRVACRKAADFTAHCLHQARCFVAQAAGELGLLQVSVAAEHHFGTVQANGLDRDLHFIRRRGGYLDMLELQDTGVAVIMEPDNARHVHL
ncbi:hypothetical protein D9M71_353450 [compost metagenome]